MSLLNMNIYLKLVSQCDTSITLKVEKSYVMFMVSNDNMTSSNCCSVISDSLSDSLFCSLNRLMRDISELWKKDKVLLVSFFLRITRA